MLPLHPENVWDGLSREAGIWETLPSASYSHFQQKLISVQSRMLPTAAAAKSLQSCSTLCDPIDGSPLGSPVPGILQVRTPEWVAIAFSNARKQKEKVRSLSRVRLLSTPWTAAYQAPPSMGFSRQEYWSGVPLPSPECCLGDAQMLQLFIYPLCPNLYP